MDSDDLCHVFVHSKTVRIVALQRHLNFIIIHGIFVTFIHWLCRSQSELRYSGLWHHVVLL